MFKTGYLFIIDYKKLVFFSFSFVRIFTIMLVEKLTVFKIIGFIGFSLINRRRFDDWWYIGIQRTVIGN